MQTAYDSIFAASPGTTRGQTTVLSIDAKGEKLVYGSQRCVVIRSVADPLKAELYSEHAKEVTVAKISPSGFYVASGDVSGLVKIWSYDNPEHPIKFEGQVFSGAVCDLQWSPDSQRVVAVGDGRESFGRVFTWDTGSSVGEVAGHSKKILSCDFKPSRPFQIITSSEDLQVAMHAGPPFKFAQSLKAHTKFVNCVRYSPDGERFCTVGSDMKAYVFESKGGEKVGELVGHKGTIYAVAWAPDGSKLVTASADKTVMFWDGATYACLGSTSFSPKPAAEDMQVGVVWAGSTVISLSLRGELSFIDPSNPAAVSKTVRGHNKSVTCLAAEGGVVVAASYDGLVNRFQVGSTESKRLEGKGHSNAVVDMAISGSEVISVGLDDTLRTTGLEMMEPSPNALSLGGQPSGLAVLPDRSGAVVATNKGVLLCKSAGGGAWSVAVTVPTAGWTANGVAVSPNGQEVAVGGDDNNVHLFSLSPSALTPGPLLSAHGSPVTKVAYSPDGRLLASGDAGKEVIVWDTAAQKPVNRELVYHQARITCLCWAPDSNRLASGSLDTKVIVWDMQRGTKDRVLLDRAHLGGVNAVRFVEACKLVSTGADGNIKIWVV